MESDVPKQYCRLGARTLLEHSVAALMSDRRLQRVVVVIARSDRPVLTGSLPVGVSLLSVGGSSRAHSVLNGLRALALEADPADRVLVHDAARPCLSAAELGALIDLAGQLDCGGLLAIPVSDTVKRVKDSRVLESEPRAGLWRAQTPQLFPLGLLLRALEQADELDTITDESSAVEGLGVHPQVVEGSVTNVKVTTPADWILAEAILKAQKRW
jgi:2-C-methyl-D-erythritol 4-phosphate cytidylyltransferase